jgi:UPF0176 protein
MMKNKDKANYQVILFYKFVAITDPETLKNQQQTLCKKLKLSGRLLIASEGINGTFEGKAENIAVYIAQLQSDNRFNAIKFKISTGNSRAFPNLKIKVRDEIVALKSSKNICPAIETATNIAAHELEHWYKSGEDFVILDLRNDYEIKCGYFEKTINPGLQNFRDLGQDRIAELANDPRIKNKKVLTVCTGGVRCEKATCLMDSSLFPNLYQLKDGIHDYLEKFPNSHFKGTLFVFDNRVTTDVGAGESGEREIIGTCELCNDQTENYAIDLSGDQRRRILCCKSCEDNGKFKLRPFIAKPQTCV